MIRKLYAEHANSQVNDFDFFRFNPNVKKEAGSITDKYKLNDAKRRIQDALREFVEKYKKGNV